MNFGSPTGETAASCLVNEAIDKGINVIDCADVYNQGEAERILGNILKSNRKRKDVLLTSKVFNPTGSGPNDKGNSRHHIIEGCENSLKRLQTDYLDIYYLHRTDFFVHQEESLEALNHLRQQGKIRYAACSTQPAWRTVEGLNISERYGYPRFVCEQPPYNLLDRRSENEIIPMCQHYDLGVMAWSPIAQGILAGKYLNSVNFPEGSRGNLRDVFRERISSVGIEIGKAFVEYAKKKDYRPSQLATAWVLNQPGITSVIIGPRNIEQFDDLLPSYKIQLTMEDRAFCDDLVPPGRYVTSFFNTTDWMLSKGI
jgi:aryl-alcohol dehydrogenase-like predicted oxidoreductase